MLAGMVKNVKGKSLRKFVHKFVPEVELTTEHIDGKRYYVFPDGVTKLLSVTTVLGEKLDKTGLLEWRARVGEEEANKISVQASRRGTVIHDLAERYLRNEDMGPILRRTMPVNVETFNSIKPELDAHIGTILGIELPLYSKGLGCAGRTDLVAEYDGVVSIVDFKTSKQLKKVEQIESYFLQTTIYSMMFEWLYKIAVPQIVLIIAVDHEKTPQTFVMERSKYIDRIKELFT